MNITTFNLRQVNLFLNKNEIGRDFFDQSQVCVTGDVLYLTEGTINLRFSGV